MVALRKLVLDHGWIINSTLDKAILLPACVLLAVLAVTLNLTVVWTQGKLKLSRISSVSCVYLINLAICDAFMAVFAFLPFSLYQFYFGGHWPAGQLGCYLWEFGNLFLTSTSLYSELAISLDRWWNLEKPMWVFRRNRKLAQLQLLVVWLLPLVVSIYSYSSTVVNRHEHDHHKLVLPNTSSVECGQTFLPSWANLVLMAFFYIPVILLFCVFGRIGVMVSSHMRFLAAHAATHKVNSSLAGSVAASSPQQRISTSGTARSFRLSVTTTSDSRNSPRSGSCSSSGTSSHSSSSRIRSPLLGCKPVGYGTLLTSDQVSNSTVCIQQRRINSLHPDDRTVMPTIAEYRKRAHTADCGRSNSPSGASQKSELLSTDTQNDYAVRIEVESASEDWDSSQQQNSEKTADKEGKSSVPTQSQKDDPVQLRKRCMSVRTDTVHEKSETTITFRTTSPKDEDKIVVQPARNNSSVHQQPYRPRASTTVGRLPSQVDTHLTPPSVSLKRHRNCSTNTNTNTNSPLAASNTNSSTPNNGSPNTAVLRARVPNSIWVVSVGFAFCWLPILLVWLVGIVANLVGLVTPVSRSAQIAALCANYFGAVLRPLIYTFNNPRSRAAAQTMLTIEAHDKRNVGGTRLGNTLHSQAVFV